MIAFLNCYVWNIYYIFIQLRDLTMLQSWKFMFCIFFANICWLLKCICSYIINKWIEMYLAIYLQSREMRTLGNRWIRLALWISGKEHSQSLLSSETTPLSIKPLLSLENNNNISRSSFSLCWKINKKSSWKDQNCLFVIEIKAGL